MGKEERYIKNIYRLADVNSFSLSAVFLLEK